LLAQGPTLALHLIEFTSDSATQTALLGGEAVYSYEVSPADDVVGLAIGENLKFVDLDAPEDNPTVVSFGGIYGGNPSSPAWSPDGHFVFVVVNDDLRVLKLEGNEASSPISLKGETDVSLFAAWQPAP
jgi:hypothetical protein